MVPAECYLPDKSALGRGAWGKAKPSTSAEGAAFPQAFPRNLSPDRQRRENKAAARKVGVPQRFFRQSSYALSALFVSVFALDGRQARTAASSPLSAKAVSTERPR